MTAFSISIDLDTLKHYHRIHGLNDPQGQGPDPIYTHALPQWLRWLSNYGFKATFFVIGEDLEIPEHVEVLKEAIQEGHEVANHTQHHSYGMSKLSPEAQRREIEEGHASIQKTLGQTPVGFRAPGYDINGQILKHLLDLEYDYDSSVFPCPPYYAAKALIMLGLALRKRPSRSSLINPKTLLTPLQPYRPHLEHCFLKSDLTPLVEIPMAVLPFIRWPLIGTSLIAMGPQWSARVLKWALNTHDRLLHLEFHGIDALDPELSSIDAKLKRVQPDLHFDMEHKHRVWTSIAQVGRGLDTQTLREWVSRFQAKSPTIPMTKSTPPRM